MTKLGRKFLRRHVTLAGVDAEDIVLPYPRKWHTKIIWQIVCNHTDALRLRYLFFWYAFEQRLQTLLPCTRK
jgi:hypothetical protein